MNKKMFLYAFLLLAFSVSSMRFAESQEPAPAINKDELIVPEGTVLPIILTAYLNTRNSQVGDTVYAETTYPIWIQQQLVIPKGSSIRGTVTEVTRPGRIRGKGSIAVRFDDVLLPNGVKRDLIAAFRGIHGAGAEKIDRKTESVSAGSESTPGEIGTVVGTSGEGAIIGVLAGQGGAGPALIGAGAGAAAGLATVLFSRNRHLVISPGTQFDIELKRPLKFSYNELMFTDRELDSARQRTYPKPGPESRRSPAMGGQKPWFSPGIGWPAF